MAIYSIGHVNPYSDEEQTPTEHVQVEASTPDSPVTRIINTGDNDSFAMAHDEMERHQRHGITPTPKQLAAGIIGSGATVNEV